MMGAWNDALASGKGLLQFRTLDWDMSGPFRDYPHITIYHPNDGNHFANIGWTGWVGSLTGTFCPHSCSMVHGLSRAPERQSRSQFNINNRYE